jgi:oligosaccharide repeat unit polymerase
VEWQGLGAYMILIRLMMTINLLYFIVLVKSKDTNLKEKIGFAINFFIYVIIALLTGSRSTLLVNIILMVIIYYYFIKKIDIRMIVAVGFSVLLLTMILGTARNGYKFKDGEFKTGFSLESNEAKFEMSNFSYGLFPLRIMTDQEDVKNYTYGLTYMSAITNLIPRTIWEDKPETGGVVFTNDYHNIHQGYSNYSTGFIVEGIINYGFFFGSIFAFILMIVIYIFFTSYYKYKEKKRFRLLQDALIFFLIYPCLLYAIPSYFHGEFTTVTHSIFLNRVLFIVLCVKFVIPKKIKYIEINQ